MEGVRLLQWKKLISETYTKKYVKKWREILLDIVCVDLGFKPCLLWDYAQLGQEKLSILISTAKKQSLIHSCLVVVTIETDLAILNRDAFKGDQSISSSEQIRAVDVSSSLNIPSVLKDYGSLQGTFEVYLKLVTQDEKEIYLSENVFNPSTLFGLLLGFPVVYWYEMDDENRNCLSNVPLRVYRVVGHLKVADESRVHTVYSFSVPMCVLDTFSEVVSKWFDQLYQRFQWKSLFSSVELREETVTLDTVCL